MLQALDTDRSIDHAIDRLAGLLVSGGHCDATTIARGRRVGAESGQRLDHVLLQLGLVTERELAQAYSELTGFALAEASRYPDEPLCPNEVGARFLRHARAVPVAISKDALVVAQVDPLDPFVPAAIGAATGRSVRTEIAVPIELEAALNRLYPEETASSADVDPILGREPLAEDAERLRDLASEAPVIRLVNQIIGRAVETRASDIHIEPFEDRLRIRYRYDGILTEADSPPPQLAAAITSRVKIMARLDIAERRVPQDGRIKLAVRGQDIDFRVSTVPALHGEVVVLRVLDRSAVVFDYDQLGLATQVVQRLQDALALPNGLVLVTGPTGSGKTTTLYTALLGLNAVSRKVITLEDPIEFQLRGIIQIQVKPQIDLNFANLLPSVLRQDPDVIMVGEIRDVATAQISMEAALTGHLVLSTLHTNSAAAAITRLRDMGVEDYLLTAVLRGILAQRLVRRLCDRCREETDAPVALVERFDLVRRSGQAQPHLWRAVGCPHCRQTGFRGRQAIAEFLVPNAEIVRMIFAHADETTIERAAINAGMVTMFDAGLAAALAGDTTVEEVVRSVRAAG